MFENNVSADSLRHLRVSLTNEFSKPIDKIYHCISYACLKKKA